MDAHDEFLGLLSGPRPRPTGRDVLDGHNLVKAVLRFGIADIQVRLTEDEESLVDRAIETGDVDRIYQCGKQILEARRAKEPRA